MAQKTYSSVLITLEGSRLVMTHVITCSAYSTSIVLTDAHFKISHRVHSLSTAVDGFLALVLIY